MIFADIIFQESVPLPSNGPTARIDWEEFIHLLNSRYSENTFQLAQQRISSIFLFIIKGT